MDLTSHYMGLKLSNPLIVSASPLSGTFENFKRMEDAGASAVVMYSLFEEQMNADEFVNTKYDKNRFTDAQQCFPAFNQFSISSECYLDMLYRASRHVSIPVIGSINGTIGLGWLDYAKQMQQAGAAAIELNLFHLPTLDTKGSELEQRYINAITTVKNHVSIPVALKMNPFFSSLGNMAQQLDNAGIDALVLFNRFFRPDFDIDLLTVRSDMGLSIQQDIRLPLQWIGMLHGNINASIAATRGVQTYVEVVKYLLAGADAVMVASSLLKHGIEYLEPLRNGLIEWMQGHDFDSVSQMRGIMSKQNIENPDLFERANYVKNLESFRKRYW